MKLVGVVNLGPILFRTRFLSVSDTREPVDFAKLASELGGRKAEERGSAGLVERVLGVPGILDQLQDLCDQIEAFEVRPPKIASPSPTVRE